MTQPPDLSAMPCLFDEAFAARPQDAYAALRAAGPVSWAQIAPHTPALVVTGHRAAVELLTHPDDFTKDSRRWAALNSGQVPPDSPVLAIMAFRPNVLFAHGKRHKRLRRVVEDCLARIDMHELRERTQTHAAGLIAAFVPKGRAELMATFADMLPLLTFADILGCPAGMAGKLVKAGQGVIGAQADAAQAATDFATVLGQLVAEKRSKPGDDLTSWMIAHPARLSDEEIIHQLFCFVGAGTIPTASWIAQALLLLLNDDSYAGALSGGTVTIRRAMEKALWLSPLANFAVYYAVRPTTLLGTIAIPPDTPIMISHAATGADPELAGLGYDNRSHLAWSLGEHRCPAESQAGVMTQAALETVLERLWDLDLEGPRDVNRPGPFFHCPRTLGIRFRAQPADEPAVSAASSGGPA
ncbi:cytochrome P450 [Streptomyces sp. NPDC058653]|uniref:cytochrome P450 n=1 Tax=Streptomyces sp. NPDC058653 TaxID=3346576 RepID=UPI0036698CF6